jgi:hypothetical protein
VIRSNPKVFRLLLLVFVLVAVAAACGGWSWEAPLLAG